MGGAMWGRVPLSCPYRVMEMESCYSVAVGRPEMSTCGRPCCSLHYGICRWRWVVLDVSITRTRTRYDGKANRFQKMQILMLEGQTRCRASSYLALAICGVHCAGARRFGARISFSGLFGSGLVFGGVCEVPAGVEDSCLDGQGRACRVGRPDRRHPWN